MHTDMSELRAFALRPSSSSSINRGNMFVGPLLQRLGMKCDAVISDVACALHANANLGMRRLNLWTSLFKRVINERALESAEDYRASKISQTHRDGMKSESNGNERMSLSASDQRCKLMMPCSSFNEAIQRSVKMAESKKPCRNGLYP